MRKLKISLLAIAGFLLVSVIGYYFYYNNLVDNIPVPARAPEVPFYPGQPDSLVFHVIGDSGTGDQTQLNTAAAMEARCLQRKPDAILHVGDVIYPHGVESVDDPQWQQKLFDVYGGECMGQVPIFPVLGNHDYDGSIQAWYDMSRRNDRWHFPYRHYVIEYPGIVRIFAIDSVYPIRIEEAIPDFTAAPSGWTIAMGHHPLGSASDRGGGHSSLGLRGFHIKNQLCDLVDSYLAGHSHHLEYSEIEECRTDQFLSAGGGGALYGVRENHTSEFAVATNGFIELEVSPATMLARYISASGDILFEKHKEKP